MMDANTMSDVHGEDKCEQNDRRLHLIKIRFINFYLNLRIKLFKRKYWEGNDLSKQIQYDLIFTN